MGMDVYGNGPSNEKGEYFRNNVWWWRPLANYCQHVAPEITSACEYWHTNDGDGLDEDDSLALAKVLREELASGRTVQYQIEYEERLARLPKETCDLCHGTGVRRDSLGVGAKQPELVIPTSEAQAGTTGYSWMFAKDHPRAGQKGWCNGCDGRGYKDAWDANYPFSAENVQEFAEFLENCGGFRIC